LESAEFEQQYSGQKNAIFTIVWGGASQTQNKATAIKIGHFQKLITVNWIRLLKNQLASKRTTNPAF
jgi:hypothetical protein